MIGRLENSSRAGVRRVAPWAQSLAGPWTRRFGVVDVVVIGFAVVLAAITLRAASYPIADTIDIVLLPLGWGALALIWSTMLLVAATNSTARTAAVGLLVGSAAVLVPGSAIMLVIFTGRVGILLGIIVAVALFAIVVVREPRRKVGWLVPPLIVAMTLGVLFTGAPRLARMWVAEPALTAYAQQLLRGDAVYAPRPHFGDEPIEVGSIPIYEVFIEGGVVHLVTAYVGMLGDDGAGIAYLPGGTTHPRYEHFMGAWYRWYPYWID